MESSSVYDVIIIGAGPAGLTAGVYTSRAALKTLIIERETIGGELMNRDMIENYPGYPEGVLGPELGSKMATHVMNLGTEIRLGQVTGLEISGDYRMVKTEEGSFSARSIIIAGGASPLKLNVPGEEEFANRGVFYCATCDGPGFAKKAVAVAGGGDSGITEGLFLAKLGCQVTILEVMPQLNATRVLQDRALATPAIQVRCGTKIEAVTGDSEVRGLNLVDIKTGTKSNIAVNGLLVHIGLKPRTEYLKGVLALNNRGQVVVNDQMQSEVAGVYAAGDVRSGSAMQISTAVGDGATAAMSLCRYLRTR